MSNKEEKFQERWLKKFKAEQEDNTGFGGFFKRLTSSATPGWKSHWENMFLSGATNGHRLVESIKGAALDKDTFEGFKSEMTELEKRLRVNPATPPDISDSGLRHNSREEED